MNPNDINSLESEAGVIATLIHKPDFFFYRDNLLPNHFSDKYNQVIYAAIAELAQKGIKTVDAYNILEAVESSDTLKKIADDLTVERLQELIDMSDVLCRTSPEEYTLLADNVLDAAFRRETFRVLKECQGLCYDRNQSDVQKQVYSAIDDVMFNYTKATDLPQYKDVVDSLWEKIEARQRGETTAIDFPFPMLNEYVVMEPGEVVCFTAGAKGGKSAILLTIAMDLLCKDKSVLYIDSELSDSLWTIRLMAHMTGIPFGRIRSGQYTEEERQKINSVREWVKTKRLIHVYMPVLDGNTMYLAAKRAKHLIDVDVIIVDYLKADSSKDSAYEVYANLGNTADILKNKIAGEMGICGLTAAQMTSTGKIADSARIARSMSTVVAIMDSKPEEVVDNPPPNGAKRKKLRVVYNRNGAMMDDNDWIDMDFYGGTLYYQQSAIQHSREEPF